MSIRSESLAGKPSSPLDVQLKSLSIRTLDRKTPAPPSVDRVRGEFTEMRGFSPTLSQAARLFNLPVDECARVLTALVQEGSLRRDEDGRYRRY
jgi:hypothetical protein